MTDPGPIGWLLALAFVTIAGATLLSAGEEAGRAVTRAAAAEAKAAGKRGADATAQIAEDSYLTVRVTAYFRLVLEMAGAVCIAFVVAPLFDRWWTALLVTIAILAAVMLGVVVVSPRQFGRRSPVSVLALAAPVMVALARISIPITTWRRPDDEAERTAGEDESLQDMVDRVAESSNIEDDEREMLQSVFELAHTMVREIMVPRTDMLIIHQDTTIDDALGLFVQSGFSRIPVIGESVDDLLGVLYLKDVLRYSRQHPSRLANAVHHLMREPVFIPETKVIDDVLADMRASGVHIALAFDEYGGVAGLVTIEDILEELVGELTDEHDAAEPEVGAIEGGYRVPARYSLDELAELRGHVVVRTDDEHGTPGAADLLDGVDHDTAIYCCGPTPMTAVLIAVSETTSRVRAADSTWRT